MIFPLRNVELGGPASSNFQVRKSNLKTYVFQWEVSVFWEAGVVTNSPSELCVIYIYVHSLFFCHRRNDAKINPDLLPEHSLIWRLAVKYFREPQAMRETLFHSGLSFP